MKQAFIFYKTKMALKVLFCQCARGQGFEPRFTASKAAVLPLDDPRIKQNNINGISFKRQA